MIDTLLAYRDKARSIQAPRRYGLNGRFGLMTLHRPANVDSQSAFEGLLSAIDVISTDIVMVFPVHPRTRPALLQSTTARRLVDDGRLKLLDPLGYLDFIGLMQESDVVLTDSGGIQEETTILGVPCLTLRNNTERPVTVTNGTNMVVGTRPEGILRAWNALRSRPRQSSMPPLWDGHAAERIADVLGERFGPAVGAGGVQKKNQAPPLPYGRMRQLDQG